MLAGLKFTRPRVRRRSIIQPGTRQEAGRRWEILSKEVRLLSRNRTLFNDNYPVLIEALKTLKPKDILLMTYDRESVSEKYWNLT